MAGLGAVARGGLRERVSRKLKRIPGYWDKPLANIDKLSPERLEAAPRRKIARGERCPAISRRARALDAVGSVPDYITEELKPHRGAMQIDGALAELRRYAPKANASGRRRAAA